MNKENRMVVAVIATLFTFLLCFKGRPRVTNGRWTMASPLGYATRKIDRELAQKVFCERLGPLTGYGHFERRA